MNLPIYNALCSEVETLRQDLKWLASELSDSRKKLLDSQKHIEKLTREKEFTEAHIRNFCLYGEKTKGQIEAEKLASLVSNIDGRKWAEVFCEFNPAIDKTVMIGWFCNAIMTGYDEALNRIGYDVNMNQGIKKEGGNADETV